MYTTCLGGSGDDRATGPAVNYAGEVYVTGFTSSTNFPTVTPIQISNGGVLRFGPDGKLYILMGDDGRRGFLQNLSCGPTGVCPGPTVADDQYGGPEPDNNHLTGFILRLNDDGTTPPDNPFFNASTTLTGEAAANIKKLCAYGVRNGFGMGFDPLSGNLWNQENGDDAFDEMNRVTAGSNNGWIRGQFGTVASASSFQFNAATLNVPETAGSALVTVTRLGNTSAPATVDYAASNGTANSPTDYTPVSGTLSFAAGETFKTFSVPVVDDLYVEGNETLKLSLSNPTGGAFLGSPNTSTLTIVDNDTITTSPPELIFDESGPAANQATAFDSILFLRDPFPVQSVAQWLNLGADRNTRVVIVVANLRLNPGETASAVVVNLVGSNSQSYDVTAEDVRLIPNSDFAQVTFRLPDSLASGACTVTVKAHSQVSNTGTISIAP